MCVKSHRHLCFQIFVIIVLLVCLFGFFTIIVTELGLYLLTNSAALVQNSHELPSPLQTQGVLVDPATNMTVNAPQAQQASTQQNNIDEELSLSDWLVNTIVNTNCSWINSTVQTGQLLQICEASNPFINDHFRVQCFRKYLFEFNF